MEAKDIQTIVDELEPLQNNLVAKGFFSLQIVDPDGTIVGEVYDVPNLVTRHGFQHICLRTGTALTGTQFSHLNVGTGGAPATNATSLTGEVTGQSSPGPRQTATAATQAGSVTLRFTGTMSSSNSFVTQTADISNVGIFNHSTGSSLCAGAAYTSSNLATNQNVNIKRWCHLLATTSSKLVKFGEQLLKSIPSQVIKAIDERCRDLMASPQLVPVLG